VLYYNLDFATALQGNFGTTVPLCVSVSPPAKMGTLMSSPPYLMGSIELIQKAGEDTMQMCKLL
jgi:hypothetical protein